RPDHAQIALVTGAARDDERVPLAEARLERGELDALREQLALLAQVAHRVLGERLERLGYAPALLAQQPLELALVEHAPGRETGAVAVDAGTAHGHELALVEVVEQLGAGHVDQPYARAHERQRSGIGEAARLRLR